MASQLRLHWQPAGTVTRRQFWRAKIEHMSLVSSTDLGVSYSPRSKSNQISQYQRSCSTRQWSKILHHVKFSVLTSLIPLKSHRVYKYDLVHLHFNEYSSHRLLSGLRWPPNTRPREYEYPQEDKDGVIKILGYIFEMDETEDRTNGQDDANNGNHPEEIENSDLASSFTDGRAMNTVGWCSGTSSWPVFQVESR